ncbi:MAG TPA: FG-GAP-like repeat-containing protein [Ohtaekwangia sp.]
MRRILVFTLLFTLLETAHAQISSTFDADADGWTFLNTATTVTPTHSGSGGNPGGFISLSYSASTGVNTQSWIAPAKFLGSHVVRSLGMSLKFDLQQSHAGSNSNGTGDVRIETTSLALVYSLPVKPAVAPSWSSYSLPLDETLGWRINGTAGTLATRAQIIAVLSNISSIEIRGTYVTNATYTSAIDNVVLEQKTLTSSPVITSFSPASGTPGTSIVLTGNNFDPTPTNNLVYFGAIAGTITTASPTQLTVTVPIGAQYEKLTVINKTTGLAKQSAKAFTPGFANGGRIIPASFDTPVNLPAGSDYGAANADDFLSLGDVDGDGWTDLISTDDGNTVAIYRNLGAGGELTPASFAPKFTLTDAGNRVATKAIDLDGDGKLDIVTGYYTDDFNTGFATYRNISTPGTLAFEAVEKWRGLAYSAILSSVTDVDGDGRADLIGRGTSGSVDLDFWIAQNISTPGNIEFGGSRSYFGNNINGLNRVVDADLDNDGKPEMIIARGNIFIAKNTSAPGSISFDALLEIIPGHSGQGVYGAVNVADFNLDGKMDLAWKHGYYNDDVHIRINTNSGGSLATTDFDTEILLNSELHYYGGISIGDINGDSKPDIIATDDNDVGVFENKYSGGVFDADAFGAAHQLKGIGSSTYPKSPAIADLNGDLKPELILYHTNVSASTDYISIHENKNVRAPEISINTVSPLAAPVGATLTITGDHFSTVPTENIVMVGGVRATVLSATKTQLTASVPAGSTYGLVTVTRDMLTAEYRLPFKTTFSPGVTFDNTHFLPPVSFALTAADYDVEVGDLNKDGKPEVMAEGLTNRAAIFRNTHTTGPISISSLAADDTLAGSPLNPRLIDIDGDGYLDINSNSGVYKNITTASEVNFATVIAVGIGSNHSFGDYNRDGKMDMLGANGANISIAENRSASASLFTTGAYGTFSTTVNYAKAAANGGTATADFDNDGWMDFVATNPGADNVTVWKNNGSYRINTTQFTALPVIATGDNPGRIYAGDLDTDGKMDLLLYHGAGTTTTMITVLHNQSTTGNIVFARVDYTIPGAATVAHISDLDGDGKPEILANSEATDQFFILKNISTPGTLNASSFATPFVTAVTNPRGLTTGDLNLDGKPEIIITSAPNSLLVFENVISSGPSITISAQPASTAVCNGSIATLSMTATGAANLAYQWQKYDGSVFNTISNGGGYTGVTTSTLFINTTGNFGAGDYRCKVSGDLATDEFSNTATVTINAVPAAPATTGATNCTASVLTLTASGGINGQYRWYDVATGGVSISGQLNSSYTTPVISASTTYYVAINNGSCESSRTSVTAAIEPLAKPTLNPSVVVVNGTINICTGDMLTITAASGFTTYTWSNGASTNPVTVTASTVALTLQVANGSCTSPLSDPLDVIVNSFPVATITPDATQLTASPGDSFQWYKNGDAIAQATAQFLEYNITEYGEYTVDVTENGCTTTSDEFIYLITEAEQNNASLKIYPNPFSDQISIELPSTEKTEVIIVDAFGRETRRYFIQKITTLTLNDLAAGAYTLIVQSPSRNQYFRLIKTH